jgi:serine protease Do
MRFVRGVVLLAATVAAVPAARGQEPKRTDVFAALEERLRKTAELAGPSIATVVVSRSEHYPKPAPTDPPGKLGGFDPKEFLKADPSVKRAELARFLDLSDVRAIADHGYAGGVVIDAAGYVLTPYHVIDGAAKVYVFLPGGKGSYADIRAADARADLAVLKLLNPPPQLQAVKIADVRTVPTRGRDATVFTGKLCVLMANPYSSTFGIGQPSAAFGSITSVQHRAPGKTGRTAGRRYPEYAPLLEYDLKLGAGTIGGLNAGVTGGVLLNLEGEMIGLTNAAAVAWGKDIGPGYAIPADENFRRVVDVLKRGEEVEYGFLGVRQPDPRLDPLIEPDAIVPIAGGGAAAAGIQAGDVIARINGVPLVGADSFDDLLLHVGSALAGSTVKITVLRNRRPLDFDVTLGKFSHGEPFIASVRPEPVFGLRVEYTTTLAVKQDRNQRGGIPSGVCVREVVDDSPAAARFKTLGDTPTSWVITHVDGTAVASPADFYKAARGKEKVKLTLFDPSEMPPRDRELTLP